MNRLRDQRSSADATVARAARLLSSRAPLADDVARQQRVRARLRRRRRAPFGASLLRVALLVAVICSVAAASAMIGRVAISIRARLKAASVAAPETHASLHRRRASTPAAPTAAAPPTEAPPADAPPADAPPPIVVAAAPPVAAAPAVAAPAPVAAPPPAPLRVAPPRPAPATPALVETDEQRLITSAVRALRHEHDPARAATLFARYIDRYPDGIATEDALALGLEATLGRDRPRATIFATRYLSRYPSGRWSTLARRALEP